MSQPGRDGRTAWRLPCEIVIIALGVGLAFSAAMRTSPTVEEGKRIANGLAFAMRGHGLHDDTVSARLHALLLDPSGLALDLDALAPRGSRSPDVVFTSHRAEAQQTKLRARVASVAAFALLLLFVAAFARKLLPQSAGIAALALAALEPTLIGHAAVATADVLLAAAAVAGGYALFCFVERPTLLRATFVGAAMGACAAAKVPGILVAATLFVLVIAWAWPAQEAQRTAGRRPGWRVVAVVLVALAALGTLDASYAFRELGRSLSSIESPPVDGWRAGPLGRARLPVPAAYVRAVERTIAEVGRASTEAHAYFLTGEVYDRHRWSYFPLAFVFKVSALHLLLLALGLAVLARAASWPARILVAVPSAYLLANVFLNPFDDGVRHLLPILPFTALIAGHGVDAPILSGVRRYVPLGLVALLAVSVALEHPNELAAFNVSSWVVARAQLLRDSNLDWGQMNDLVLADAAAHSSQPTSVELVGVVLDPLAATVPRCEGIGRCRYYTSTSRLDTQATLVALGSPTRSLGGVVDLRVVEDEHDPRFEPLALEVSEPVPARGRSRDMLSLHAPELVFHARPGPFGLVHNRFGPDECIAIRTVNAVTGEVYGLRGLTSVPATLGTSELERVVEARQVGLVACAPKGQTRDGWVQFVRRKEDVRVR